MPDTTNALWRFIAFRPTNDVLILEGPVAVVAVDALDATVAASFARKAGFDPRQQREDDVYLQLALQRILAWRGPSELAGRVVMRVGRWLADAQ